MPAPNSPQTKRRANGKFLPKPLLFHLRHNSKTNEPKFWQILSPKIALPKLRPHCSATCLNTWKAEPRKKNTLSFFKRNFTPAKSEMQGVFFLSGLPRLCEAVAERFIHHLDFARNTFELCPEHTAKTNRPRHLARAICFETPTLFRCRNEVIRSTVDYSVRILGCKTEGILSVGR